MAVNNKIQFVDYGLTQALTVQPPYPIVSPLTKFQTGRNPTTSDFAQIGTIWVNTSANAAYILTSIVGNSATWSAVGGGAGVFTSIALPDTTAGYGQGFISFGGTPFIADYGTSNVFLGKSAGNATLTTASATENTAVGDDALTDLTTGSANTAVGYFAANATTTGSDNVAVGIDALTDLTTGSNNVALGAGALEAITTVSNLVAIGSGALGANTSGTNNVAVGFDSLGAVTTGGGNTAVGSNALKLATGASNTAVGSLALTAAVATSNSTALGANALLASTSAVSNTAIGSAALTAVTSSSTNIALGVSAGAALTTGSGDNMFLGHQAGNGILTGASNVIIGFQSGSNYAGAESSNICVNNAGVATESNVMRIGTSGSSAGQVSKTFIAGVAGVTTGVADAVAVLVSASTGQFGTTSSSLRYKENVEDMDNYSSALLKARPVTFKYKSQDTKKRTPGLIAEEFNALYPDLVIKDAEGRPETIQYHELIVMLLNEIQRLNDRVSLLECE